MAGGQVELVALTKRFTEVAVDGIDLHRGQRRVLLPARALRLREDDHAAADRRLRAAHRGPDPARRDRRVRRPAAQAQRQHGVPELRAVPVPVACSTTWRSGCATAAAQGGDQPAGGRGARPGPADRLRQAPPRPAVRRPAAAGRAGPGAGAQPRRAAARRAARRARRQAAPLAQGRAQGAAGAGRHHVPLRHPRPGGGADHVRPAGGDARRPDRADRRPARRLRGARATPTWPTSSACRT